MVFSGISGCAMSKKDYRELRGLMLLEDTQIVRNRPYHSKQNVKNIRYAQKKYHKDVKYRRLQLRP